jgi:hypothetical protein
VAVLSKKDKRLPSSTPPSVPLLHTYIYIYIYIYRFYALVSVCNYRSENCSSFNYLLTWVRYVSGIHNNVGGWRGVEDWCGCISEAVVVVSTFRNTGGVALPIVCYEAVRRDIKFRGHT